MKDVCDTGKPHTDRNVSTRSMPISAWRGVVFPTTNTMAATSSSKRLAQKPTRIPLQRSIRQEQGLCDLSGAGSPERMYLQETLSGHSEMAEDLRDSRNSTAIPPIIRSPPEIEEFASWKWELPIRISHACGWGLPDSNDSFPRFMHALFSFPAWWVQDGLLTARPLARCPLALGQREFVSLWQR